jgi:hypothetical protein
MFEIVVVFRTLLSREKKLDLSVKLTLLLWSKKLLHFDDTLQSGTVSFPFCCKRRYPISDMSIIDLVCDNGTVLVVCGKKNSFSLNVTDEDGFSLNKNCKPTR